MKSECEGISQAIDLGNLGVIAPHKVKYYNRYNIDWLIDIVKTGTQLKYMALLFKDLYHYGLIMEEPSPKKCKDLGRLVSGFESTTWDNALREIIFHGNLGKFQSDIVLVNALLETENAVLIEASPYDGIYGAGLTESDLLNSDGSLKVQPENWKNPKNGTQATNHLGFVLMGIRDLFRQLMGHSWRPGEENKSF